MIYGNCWMRLKQNYKAMPIIKSIGRKDSNFKQLIHYLHKLDGGEKEMFTYLHNLSGVMPDDLEGIEEAFKNNNAFRRKRKNGIGQYHEVMSFHPDDTAYLQEHPEILEDLARVYLGLRAPHTLAIARPHTDKNHLHLHFMISPNELGSSKSIRLSKKQFQALRRTMESYQLEYYPELTKSYVQSRDKEKYEERAQTQRHKEWQMGKRGVGILDKERLASVVKEALAKTDDLAVFQDMLGKEGVEVYRYRGKVQGVVYNGRKYRFGRLLGADEGMKKIVDGWNVGVRWIGRNRSKSLERNI